MLILLVNFTSYGDVSGLLSDVTLHMNAGSLQSEIAKKKKSVREMDIMLNLLVMTLSHKLP